MAQQRKAAAIAPVAHLTARELLTVVDRSHPHIDALATQLERLLDGADALSRRLFAMSEEAENAAYRASELRQEQLRNPHRHRF